MHGVDGGLELVGAGLVAAKARADDRLALFDQGLVPLPAVLLAEQDQRAVGRVRDARRDSVRSSSASSPATSGSSA